jgi:hypothetical protein
MRPREVSDLPKFTHLAHYGVRTFQPMLLNSMSAAVCKEADTPG